VEAPSVFPDGAFFLMFSGCLMITLPDESLTFSGLYDVLTSTLNDYFVLVIPAAFGFFLFYNLLRFMSGSRMR
jgi:hypothetical protein